MQALECVPLGIISLVAILFTVLIQHSVVGEGGGGGALSNGAKCGLCKLLFSFPGSYL